MSDSSPSRSERARALRVVFAGTPEFAAGALDAIAAAGHQVVLVLTRIDQPAGRGRALHESPVKLLARAHGFAIAQPRSLRDAALQAQLRALDADAMVVAAYGLILPAEVLRIPRHGCLNIHASLLPRWRGAAPIQRAIEAGDTETGITIMQMDAGLDTGAMLLRETLPIAPQDTTASLHDKLAEVGGTMIVAALLALNPWTAEAQPEAGVTYAHKIEKAESTVDWTLPAAVIGQRIRAFDPFPGASTECKGETIKVWSYAIDSVQGISNQRPGQILAADGAGVTVACGSGTALRLTTLQRAGGKRLAAADFLRGFDLQPGMVLGANPA